MNKSRTYNRVIWDSHFGYEIGYWLGDGKMYDSYEVDLITGLVQEPTCKPISEVKPYSKQLIKELSAKYGYEKDWSDVF